MKSIARRRRPWHRYRAAGKRRGYRGMVMSAGRMGLVAGCLALVAASMSGAAHGATPQIRAGFDCRKASTPVEKAICGDANTAGWDRQMSEIYAALLKKQPTDDALRRDQRAFIAERSACAAPERGAPASAGALDNCIWDLTTSRDDELARRAVAAGLTKALKLDTPDPAWDAFTDGTGKALICTAHDGRDGSDGVSVIRRPGETGPGAVAFEEFAYKGVGVLRDGDSVAFTLDGKTFPGTVAIDPPDRGPDRRFRILAAPGQAAPLLAAMQSGGMLRVVRNGKVIFRAPLDGFAAVYRKAGTDCGLTAG